MLKRFNLVLCTVITLSGVTGADELIYPVDVAVGPGDKIYIADHEAHALLVHGENGFETVAAGEGLPRTPLYGIRHIAPDSDGNVLASDPATMKLYKIDGAGKIEPIADDDRFVTPWGIAIEKSGDVLAVDRVTHRLRRVKSGGAVSDVAEIRAPRAILFDKEGTIVVLTDKNLVRVEDGTTTSITSSPPFEFPHDAVLHPDGNFYVSDGYAKAIWKAAPDGAVTPFVQGDPLVSPQGLAVDAKGNLLVADAHAKAIFLITPKGELSKLGQ